MPDLPKHGIKLVTALVKHQIKKTLGDEFLGIAGKALVDVAGETVTEKLDNFLTQGQRAEKILSAFQRADECFVKECDDYILIQAIRSHPFTARPALEKLATKLPETLDDDGLRIALRNRFAEDWPGEFTNTQLDHASGIYQRCLDRALAVEVDQLENTMYRILERLDKRVEEGIRKILKGQEDLKEDIEKQRKSLQDKIQLAGRGLRALHQMMAYPDVQKAIIEFQTDFRAVSDGIHLIEGCKKMHDLFQELEYHYYNIEHNRKRLPSDDLALETIELEETYITSIIKDLLNLDNRIASVWKDAWWSGQLALASDELPEAIQMLDDEKLRGALQRIYRVLDRQVSRVNVQLVTTAGNLHLGAIAQDMAVIKEKFEMLESIPETLTDITKGLVAIAQLDTQLNYLAQEHNTWQDMDDELRKIENLIVQDLSELEDAWPDVKLLFMSLFPDGEEGWMVSLQNISQDLEKRLSEGAIIKARGFFRRFRSEAGRRFRQVDHSLLQLCQDLQRIGEPLDLLLRTIQ